MEGSALFLEGCALILRQCWRPFTEITIPGIGISPATLAFGVLLATFSIRVLSIMLGTHIFIPHMEIPKERSHEEQFYIPGRW